LLRLFTKPYSWIITFALPSVNTIFKIIIKIIVKKFTNGFANLLNAYLLIPFISYGFLETFR